MSDTASMTPVLQRADDGGAVLVASEEAAALAPTCIYPGGCPYQCSNSCIANGALPVALRRRV